MWPRRRKDRWCATTNRASAGRVAAGAIAEKYLREAHGIEIVAFVSSVGKVHLPSSVSSSTGDGDGNEDDVEDALTPEFRKLLATITRAEVDRYTTRCPHAATSERMTKVRAKLPHGVEIDPPFSASFAPKTPWIQLGGP